MRINILLVNLIILTRSQEIYYSFLRNIKLVEVFYNILPSILCDVRSSCISFSQYYCHWFTWDSSKYIWYFLKDLSNPYRVRKVALSNNQSSNVSNMIKTRFFKDHIFNLSHYTLVIEQQTIISKSYSINVSIFCTKLMSILRIKCNLSRYRITILRSTTLDLFVPCEKFYRTWFACLTEAHPQ